MNEIDRREFLKFMGMTSLAAGALTLGCSTNKKISSKLFPSSLDDLILAEGLSYHILIKAGDKINSTEFFGYNNDFTAFIPLDSNSGLLWVNHESASPLFCSGIERTKENIIKERLVVGGSIIHLVNNGKWGVKWDSPFNRRITADTPFVFSSGQVIAGSNKPIGTLANCAGGVTPWGNILTCEENYDEFVGERNFKTRELSPSMKHGWDKFFPFPPEHYGWVVEINPKTGSGKKLVSLGRFFHECAKVTQAKDGRCAVYSGDDKSDEHLYKFIASRPGSLDEGKLYVADLDKGKWVSLDRNDHQILKDNFKNQLEIQIYARYAAKMVGATPLHRPEDIEIDPNTGNIFVSLTNNFEKGDYMGQILKIVEKDGDPLSLDFKASTFLAGGKNSGFASPDNLAFDNSGNLWMVSDISGDLLNKEPYTAFGNNGLFKIPLSGPKAGSVIQVGSAPNDAEFTGPTFSPDFKTLFLSVQHPGEKSKSLKALNSHWPYGGDAIPSPAVVAIDLGAAN
ncbi:MAG: PhoX family protein [Bacteriovoracales bacterium]